MKLWKSYLEYTRNITSCETYDKVTFRSKTYAWHEYSMDFYYDTPKVTSKKSKDPFFDIFFGGDIMNEACYDCNSRSTMVYGDIRIGDYWGEKYDTNTKGVSAVVVKTPLGKVFFESIQQKMEL